jgi:hypothetical protein
MTIKAIAATPPMTAPTIKPVLLLFFVSDADPAAGVCAEEAAVAVVVASPLAAVGVTPPIPTVTVDPPAAAVGTGFVNVNPPTVTVE